MVKKVRLRKGATNVALPNGQVYDGPKKDDDDPVEVELSDEEYRKLSPKVFAGDDPLLSLGDEGDR